jgi:hypothetical protein
MRPEGGIELKGVENEERPAWSIPIPVSETASIT